MLSQPFPTRLQNGIASFGREKLARRAAIMWEPSYIMSLHNFLQKLGIQVRKVLKPKLVQILGNVQNVPLHRTGRFWADFCTLSDQGNPVRHRSPFLVQDMLEPPSHAGAPGRRRDQEKTGLRQEMSAAFRGLLGVGPST